jgi:hypothetical protein
MSEKEQAVAMKLLLRWTNLSAVEVEMKGKIREEMAQALGEAKAELLDETRDFLFSPMRGPPRRAARA